MAGQHQAPSEMNLPGIEIDENGVEAETLGARAAGAAQFGLDDLAGQGEIDTVEIGSQAGELDDFVADEVRRDDLVGRCARSGCCSSSRRVCECLKRESSR